ncbi:MAG: lactate utilization protein [Candidatus Omnitrophota bacterium]
MEERIKRLLDIWQKRNIGGFYCPDKIAACARVLELIPVSATVGISGSETISQLALVDKLQARGTRVFNQYAKGLAAEESMKMREEGVHADFYLASANAISEKGELVFFSAYGHRISGIANASSVLVICGINKITPNIEEAVKRAREYATPLNCRRLDWKTPCVKDGICRKEICVFPEYKRMCCQILIIEAEVVPQRIKVILVDEAAGF